MIGDRDTATAQPRRHDYRTHPFSFNQPMDWTSLSPLPMPISKRYGLAYLSASSADLRLARRENQRSAETKTDTHAIQDLPCSRASQSGTRSVR